MASEDRPFGLELLSESGYYKKTFYHVKWLASIDLLEEQEEWRPFEEDQIPLDMNQAIRIAAGDVSDRFNDIEEFLVSTIRIRNLVDQDEFLQRKFGYWYYVITLYPKDQEKRQQVLEDGMGWALTSVILLDGTVVAARWMEN